MKICQFDMKMRRVSSVPESALVQSCGGEVESSVVVSLTILQSVVVLRVKSGPIAATSTTAVHRPPLVMYSRLGMKIGSASRFKVGVHDHSGLELAVNVQVMYECA